MKRTPQIGSISHGTMRAEDLINTFSSELRHVANDAGLHHGNLLDDCSTWLQDEQDENAWSMMAHIEKGDSLVNDLIDALNEYAPPYCYFGVNECDGADFGFWPEIDKLNEDASDTDDVIRVDSTPNYIMHVNDHGNVTLYRVTLEEVWSVV